MRTLRHVRTALWRVCLDDGGAQIAEFALSMPLLVIFVVGIFDFSGALALKQKLTNAAREGARVAAADPANDLGGSSTSTGVPVSVSDAFQVVDNYLLSEKINDCGLASVTPPPPTGLAWTYTASGSGCPGSGMTLKIDRGCFTSQTIGGNTTDVINTCVTIVYPYKWQFSKVSSLVGGSFTGPINITTTATALNEN
jgi:Flp pilus assembly protein TadG